MKKIKGGERKETSNMRQRRRRVRRAGRKQRRRFNQSVVNIHHGILLWL